MFFCFGIRDDGVTAGRACTLGADGLQSREAQQVAMRCGCIYIYVDGARYGIARQCVEHEGEMALVYSTIINAELPCCLN